MDLPSWLARQEEKYLGIAITCAKVDEYDTSRGNCTCKEFLDGFDSRNGIRIAAQVDAVREWKVKNGRSSGQMMAFITMSDGTCSLDNTVMFVEDWAKYKERIEEGNILLFQRTKDAKRGGLIISKVSKIKNLS